MGRQAYPTSYPGHNKNFTSFTEKMTFGKHSGKSIEEIIADDPGYLKWAIVKNVIKVTHEIENEVIIGLKEKRITHY